jgi:hypothetical protein
MPMVDKADDPIALWQQMVGEMQRGFRTFGTQLSCGSSDQTTAGSDSAQKRLADLMESYFAGMNLPSRAQLNALSDRLQAIESELTDIKALLHEALINSKPAHEEPRPEESRPSSRPRPKRPVSAKVRPPSGPVPAGQEASKDDSKPE